MAVRVALKALVVPEVLTGLHGAAVARPALRAARPASDLRLKSHPGAHRIAARVANLRRGHHVERAQADRRREVRHDTARDRELHQDRGDIEGDSEREPRRREPRERHRQHRSTGQRRQARDRQRAGDDLRWQRRRPDLPSGDRSRHTVTHKRPRRVDLRHIERRPPTRHLSGDNSDRRGLRVVVRPSRVIGHSAGAGALPNSAPRSPRPIRDACAASSASMRLICVSE